MKISEAVFRSLMGDNIVTGQDERGLYVNYDALRVTLGTSEDIQFYFKGQCVGSVSPHTVFREGDRIELRDLEGRLRINIKA